MAPTQQSLSLPLLSDVTATDSLSREFLKLKQFRINSKVSALRVMCICINLACIHIIDMHIKHIIMCVCVCARACVCVHVCVVLFSLPCTVQYDSGQLSNMVKVESLHSTLREDETVYWTRYLLSSLRSFRPSDTTQNRYSKLMSVEET